MSFKKTDPRAPLRNIFCPSQKGKFVARRQGGISLTRQSCTGGTGGGGFHGASELMRGWAGGWAGGKNWKELWLE